MMGALSVGEDYDVREKKPCAIKKWAIEKAEIIP